MEVILPGLFLTLRDLYCQLDCTQFPSVFLLLCCFFFISIYILFTRLVTSLTFNTKIRRVDNKMTLLGSMFFTMGRARKIINRLLFEVLVKYIYYTSYLSWLYCKSKTNSEVTASKMCTYLFSHSKQFFKSICYVLHKFTVRKMISESILIFILKREI